MRDKTYFISDLHLGAKYLENPLDYERRVVRFLRSIAPTAKRLYLLGDVLDYWYEYRTVVPRGFTRFFGALAELADSGVEITWFIGNHDIWIFDYIPTELGVRVVDGIEVTEIDGKRFLLTHGDGVGEMKLGFRFIRSLFRNKVCQKMFSAIHPRWTVPFAHRWSASSRAGHPEVPENHGTNEPFVAWAAEYLMTHPHIDYFVMGHRHILLDLEVAPNSRLIVLGDWVTHFSYAVFDGNNLSLELFVDGEPAIE